MSDLSPYALRQQKIQESLARAERRGRKSAKDAGYPGNSTFMCNLNPYNRDDLWNAWNYGFKMARYEKVNGST